MTMTPTPQKPAAKGDEQKIVIRPAGATPPGVRTSLGQAPVGQLPAGKAPAVAAGKAGPQAARGKAGAKGKAKPAARAKAPRRPLVERLRERAQSLRFRLLPVTIFVAVLMLGVRVGDLWQIATRDAKLPDFPVSLAQGPQNPPPSAAKPPAGKDAPPAKEAPKGAPPPAQGGASAPAAAPGAAAAPNAPLGPIDNQELLQHFAERRAEIEKRQKDVEQREALLAAAEKRIDQKVQEMEKVRADIQKLMRQGDEKQAAQLDSLVKIYETMKPKEAARIFEELDMPVLLGVIERMKEQKIAPVLAAMDPLKAKAVTSALVERRGVPSAAQQ